MSKPTPKSRIQPPRASTFRRENYYLRDLAQEYENYQNTNLRRGFIKAQALAARRTLPVEGVTVEIIKQLPSGPYVVDTQVTDISGLIEPVRVPTVPRTQSLMPGLKSPFETYDLKFMHPDFADVIIRDVPVYEGITTFQIADMVPKGSMAGENDTIEYSISEPVV